MRKITSSALLGAALALVAMAAAPSRPTTIGGVGPAWLHRGAPDLQSAGALAFTPEGLLIVGDSPGSAVFALDVSAYESAAPGGADSVGAPDLDSRVAARLGTTPSELLFNDMAVHPRSHAIYISLTRGRTRTAQSAIVRLGPSGRVDVVSLANIPFAKAVLPNPPRPGQKDQDGDDAFGRSITDVMVARGAVWVAGMTSDEFSGQLRRIALPFGAAPTSTGLRIYHSHHSRFETKSPASAMSTWTFNGHDYLIVSLACTPLTLFDMDSLAGASATGKTFAELGAGTHVTSIVPYDFGSHRYLAVSSPARSIQILPADWLLYQHEIGDSDNAGQGNPLGPWSQWGLKAFPGGIPGVMRLADFDSTRVVSLQRDLETGVVDLVMLRKPILWGHR